VVGCSGVQTTTIMYLRTVCLRINLRLNNIFCYLSNFAFFEHFYYQINQSQISKWPFVIDSLQQCFTYWGFILVTCYDLCMDHYIQQQHLCKIKKKIHIDEQDICGFMYRDGINFLIGA